MTATPPGWKPALRLLALALIPLAVGGCASITQHGYILTQTTTVLGLQVSATDASSQTPKVQLGLIRDVVEFVPTATNAPIFAANHATTIGIEHKALPFLLDLNETTASGNYQTAATTTNAANVTQPVVPAASTR